MVPIETLMFGADGFILIWFFGQGGSARAQMFVPPGSTYIASAAGGRTFDTWLEYR